MNKRFSSIFRAENHFRIKNISFIHKITHFITIRNSAKPARRIEDRDKKERREECATKVLYRQSATKSTIENHWVAICFVDTYHRVAIVRIRDIRSSQDFKSSTKVKTISRKKKTNITRSLSRFIIKNYKKLLILQL